MKILECPRCKMSPDHNKGCTECRGCGGLLGFENNDGHEDAILIVNGNNFLTIHEQAYKAIGLDYEQAKKLVSMIGLFVKTIFEAGSLK